MRATILFLAAIATKMYAVNARPSSDLGTRVVMDDLINERHDFHHFDRNQRTASQGTGVHGSNVEGSGLYFVKRVQGEREQQAKGWKMSKESRILNTRFTKNPDYSQGGSGGGSNSASPAAIPAPTQEPANTPPSPAATKPAVRM
ncbi:hypothetical protein HYDPIDRAFT_107659 [Hydnomerulius pinastri MD-312]|nr:hypothetical protein HYDPIDRAFT_107659 [Hydnomerulius pinastri MD-312]